MNTQRKKKPMDWIALLIMSVAIVQFGYWIYLDIAVNGNYKLLIGAAVGYMLKFSMDDVGN